MGDQIQYLGAAKCAFMVPSCYDDFVADLGTSRVPVPGCLELWPSTCLPPALDAGGTGNGSVKLADVLAIDNEEAGG